MSDKKDGILSAMLRIKAKPIDDEKGEGNDEILLSGFATDGTPLMTTYKIGLGIDNQPNNFFPFDWQVDDRPTVNPNGYDIIIDLAKFISKEGTTLVYPAVLCMNSIHGILDIIVSDDSNVDFIELEIMPFTT